MLGTFANNCIAIIRNRNIFNLFSVSFAAASLSFLLSSEGICVITALAYFCQNKSIHFPSIFSRQACSMYESASFLPSQFTSPCCNWISSSSVDFNLSKSERSFPLAFILMNNSSDMPISPKSRWLKVILFNLAWQASKSNVQSICSQIVSIITSIELMVGSKRHPHWNQSLFWIISDGV